MRKKRTSIILAAAVVLCMSITALAEESLPAESTPIQTEPAPTVSIPTVPPQTEPAPTESVPTVLPQTESAPTEPETTPTVPAPEPTTVLEIDTKHIYEGMDSAYESGYIPKIHDGTVQIILPLKSTGTIQGNQIKASLDLGGGASPFVIASYEKTFSLNTIVPQNAAQGQDVYLVSFQVCLAEDRINGTYPVTARISGYDDAGHPVSFEYTVFVTITDGTSAEPEPPAIPEPEQPTAEPVVFISASKLEPKLATAGKPFTLTLTLQNSLTTKSVENLLVTVDPGNLQIDLREDSSVIPVEHIDPGGTATLVLHFTTDPSIPAEKHRINFHFQYDSSKTLGLKSEGSYILDVRQEAKLDFDGATLPAKVFQQDTVTVSVNLMNTGKSPLYNCRVDYDIEGLSSGGTTFVGEIPSGENKIASGNLRVSKELLGDVTGTITITYEDAFGQAYTKTADVTTHIAEKTAPEPAEKQEASQKDAHWWIFILVGLGVGGGIGFGIPWFLKDRKQRKEDDLRL